MRLFLLFLAALTCRTAWAQFDTGAANSVLIPYSRKIPKSALHLMPRGAQSLFWGQFSPRRGSATLAIHVFSPKRKLTSGYSGRRFFNYYTQINVFQLNNSRYKKINQVLLSSERDEEYKSSDWKFKMHFLWLNQEKKRIPIITLDALAKESALPGPYGNTTFFVFDPTWRRQIKTHLFGFGDSDNGSGSGYNLSRDRQGELEVAENYGDSSESRTSVSRWDGEQFSPIPGRETHKTNYP